MESEGLDELWKGRKRCRATRRKTERLGELRVLIYKTIYIDG